MQLKPPFVVDVQKRKLVHMCGTQRNATQRNATQRNATQRNATQRNATQRNATQRNATQRNATQRNATQRNATQRNATQQNIIVPDQEIHFAAFVMKIFIVCSKLFTPLAHKSQDGSALNPTWSVSDAIIL